MHRHTFVQAGQQAHLPVALVSSLRDLPCTFGCPCGRSTSQAISAALQVDAVDFYKERIQALAEAITRGSQHLLSDPESTLPAAFVTFKTRTAQVLRFVLPLPFDCRSCRATSPSPCPEPQGRRYVCLFTAQYLQCKRKCCDFSCPCQSCGFCKDTC